MKDFLNRVFGDDSSRFLKQAKPVVAKINALEESTAALSDADFPAKTEEFKKRIADGATLEDIIPEAFALVREAAKRTLNQRHFDVQCWPHFGLVNGDGMGRGWPVPFGKVNPRRTALVRFVL